MERTRPSYPGEGRPAEGLEEELFFPFRKGTRENLGLPRALVVQRPDDPESPLLTHSGQQGQAEGQVRERSDL